MLGKIGVQKNQRLFNPCLEQLNDSREKANFRYKKSELVSSDLNSVNL